MKNIILKTLAYLSMFAWIVAACAIDSESWIPTIIICVTSAWLTLFAYANDWFEGY